MREANGGSLDNPRVNVVIDDAMTWLRGTARRPSSTRSSSTFPTPTRPCWAGCIRPSSTRLPARALAPDGLMVVQAGSPFSTPTAFWRTVSTIRAAGYAVTPYHVHVPTFGDWGFALARRGDTAPAPHGAAQRARRCASSTSGCSTPRPCSPATSGPARSSPRPWTIRASSRTCATVTTSASVPLHDPNRPPTVSTLINTHLVEPRCAALRREGLGLLFGPPVARQARGPGLHPTLHHQKPPRRRQHPSYLGEPGRDVLPVVHRLQRPRGGGPTAGDGQLFGTALRPADVRTIARHSARQPQHHRGRINADDPAPR